MIAGICQAGTGPKNNSNELIKIAFTNASCLKLDPDELKIELLPSGITMIKSNDKDYYYLRSINNNLEQVHVWVADCNKMNQSYYKSYLVINKKSILYSYSK